MNFSLLLSKVSIQKQILIGYVPVILVLAFLAYASFSNSKNFQTSFKALQNSTEENLIYLEIEKDVIELQRNVLVYSYMGYQGVLKKINFIQEKLEAKFEKLKNQSKQAPEIKDRFDRMLSHYNDYKVGFIKTRDQKNKLVNLNDQQLIPLFETAVDKITNIEEGFSRKGYFKHAYEASQIESDLYQIKSHITLFLKSPDFVLVKKTRSLFSKIEKRNNNFKTDLKEQKFINLITEFEDVIEEYNQSFNKSVTANTIYLHLINVVLAGKAAEIDKLSGELGDIILTRSQSLVSNIEKNSKNANRQFLFLSFVAGLIGLFSSILIAMGIVRPVRAMAHTLSDLAAGKAETDIPAQQREDEVGQMAKAANEFKVMANELKEQTEELEEFAYRTSHDLRSPLHSSVGLLQMSKKFISEGHTEKAVQSLGFVETSLEKLLTLVQDILLLTQTKNAEEEDQEVDIQDIINEALDKFSSMEGFERLDIQKDIRFEGMLNTKLSRLRLIVENLISNAIKYQDVEKGNSFIKISAYEEAGTFMFLVEDNGLGIPENQRENLFSMFKRFHPKVSFGSGLGLYMIKKSANILDGNISYDRSKGNTVFSFSVSKS